MALRTKSGGSLYLFHTSSEQSARTVLRGLKEETGCDRFYVELDGSDAEGDALAEVPVGGDAA